MNISIIEHDIILFITKQIDWSLVSPKFLLFVYLIKRLRYDSSKSYYRDNVYIRLKQRK
jgi:hypothetical protein